ncbi:MAG: histidine kinase [Cyclobacteriaceae bacterium]
MAELQNDEVIKIIVIGSMGMLILCVGFAVFIALYQRRMFQEQEKRRIMDLEFQNKMIQLQIDSTETERKRIAADLHDSIGSLLWAAKLNIAFLGRSVDFSGELKDSYSETMRMLDQSVDSVRRISWELTPEAFNHTGLASSIKEFCTRLDGKGQKVLYDESGRSVFWKDDRALMVYRIVQELVNNAVKHARANTIRVRLRWSAQALDVEVSDDGVGFVLNEKVRSGVGWWNITNRSNKIGAKLLVKENSPKGAAIELTVPLEP